MFRKKPTSPKRIPGHPPQKIMDVQGPTNFPAIGSTMSPHADAYLEARGITPTLAKPRPSWRHRVKWRKVIKRTLLVLIILAVLIGGWVGFKFAYNFSKVFGGNIFGIFHSTKLKGED